jgi:hypothetical protein
VQVSQPSLADRVQHGEVVNDLLEKTTQPLSISTVRRCSHAEQETLSFLVKPEVIDDTTICNPQAMMNFIDYNGLKVAWIEFGQTHAVLSPDAWNASDDNLLSPAVPVSHLYAHRQSWIPALDLGRGGKSDILDAASGMNRGLDFTEPRLYVLDGGRALTAAVRKYAGESAVIQRCQVHKRRNVLDHMTDEQKPAVARKLNAAYARENHAAKQALNALHRELMDLNPSAARSLGGGMEETLTVHRLHLSLQLRKTLASTNVIESTFSIVERSLPECETLARWRPAGTMGGIGPLGCAETVSTKSQVINRFRCSSGN